MDLYLMRHGQASSLDSGCGRPLTERGRQESVRTVQTASEKYGFRPHAVWHSGKLRARQTASIALEILNPEAGAYVVEGLLPENDVLCWKEKLEKESMPLMLVGHMPFLGKLIGCLVTGSPDREIVPLPTSTIVHLIFEQGRWRLVWSVRPDERP